MVISDHTELSNIYCYTLIPLLLLLFRFSWEKSILIYFPHFNILTPTDISESFTISFLDPKMERWNINIFL